MVITLSEFVLLCPKKAPCIVSNTEGTLQGQILTVKSNYYQLYLANSFKIILNYIFISYLTNLKAQNSFFIFSILAISF